MFCEPYQEEDDDENNYQYDIQREKYHKHKSWVVYDLSNMSNRASRV